MGLVHLRYICWVLLLVGSARCAGSNRLGAAVSADLGSMLGSWDLSTAQVPAHFGETPPEDILDSVVRVLSAHDVTHIFLQDAALPPQGPLIAILQNACGQLDFSIQMQAGSFVAFNASRVQFDEDLSSRVAARIVDKLPADPIPYASSRTPTSDEERHAPPTSIRHVVQELPFYAFRGAGGSPPLHPFVLLPLRVGSHVLGSFCISSSAPLCVTADTAAAALEAAAAVSGSAADEDAMDVFGVFAMDAGMPGSPSWCEVSDSVSRSALFATRSVTSVPNSFLPFGVVGGADSAAVAAVARRTFWLTHSRPEGSLWGISPISTCAPSRIVAVGLKAYVRVNGGSAGVSRSSVALNLTASSTATVLGGRLPVVWSVQSGGPVVAAALDSTAVVDSGSVSAVVVDVGGVPLRDADAAPLARAVLGHDVVMLARVTGLCAGSRGSFYSEIYSKLREGRMGAATGVTVGTIDVDDAPVLSCAYADDACALVACTVVCLTSSRIQIAAAGGVATLNASLGESSSRFSVFVGVDVVYNSTFGLVGVSDARDGDGTHEEVAARIPSVVSSMARWGVVADTKMGAPTSPPPVFVAGYVSAFPQCGGVTRTLIQSPLWQNSSLALLAGPGYSFPGDPPVGSVALGCAPLVGSSSFGELVTSSVRSAVWRGPRGLASASDPYTGPLSWVFGTRGATSLALHFSDPLPSGLLSPSVADAVSLIGEAVGIRNDPRHVTVVPTALDDANHTVYVSILGWSELLWREVGKSGPVTWAALGASTLKAVRAAVSVGPQNLGIKSVELHPFIASPMPRYAMSPSTGTPLSPSAPNSSRAEVSSWALGAGGVALVAAVAAFAGIVVGIVGQRLWSHSQKHSAAGAVEASDETLYTPLNQF